MTEYGPQSISWKDIALASTSFLIDEAVIKLFPSLAVMAIDSIGFITFPLIDMVETWSIPVQMLAFAVFTDFFSYWLHRWMHGRFAWPVHAFHHSAKSLNFLVVMRSGPVNIFLTSLPAIVCGIVFLRSGNTTALITIVAAQAVILNMLHTNLHVPFAKQIEYLFCTPRFHFVHHNAQPKFSNSNYGFVFTIWDRVFGTMVCPDSLKDERVLGLDYDQSDLEMFLGVRQKNSPEEIKHQKAA